MNFDYAKLQGKIKEVCKTQETFARSIGISRTSLNLRLNNKLNFSQKEIYKAINILNIDNKEIDVYFFKLQVQKNEQYNFEE